MTTGVVDRVVDQIIYPGRRQTKMLVTLGPTSWHDEMVEALILAGVDGFRINFSHAITQEDYDRIEKLIPFIRETAAKHGRIVAILQDLGGWKFRLGTMDAGQDGIVEVTPGQVVQIRVGDYSNDPGIIPLPHKDMFESMRPGAKVYLSDGMIDLEVISNNGEYVEAKVGHYGSLSSRKGIALEGFSGDYPVLTDKDKFDIQLGVRHRVDWVCLSFVCNGEGIRVACEYLQEQGNRAWVMGKVETAEAVDPENYDAILEEVDGIMVGRGDLRTAVPIQEIPYLQKSLMRKAQRRGKVVGLGTQMLDSMVMSPTPSNAEMTDVSAAVENGADYILLSNETSVGAYVLEVVKIADLALRSAERYVPYVPDLDINENPSKNVIRQGCKLAAAFSKCKFIVATTSGEAAQVASSERSENDIYVVSHDESALARLALSRSVFPIGVVPITRNSDYLLAFMLRKAIDTGVVNPLEDEYVVATLGYQPGISGKTNEIRLIRIPADLDSYFALAEHDDVLVPA
jgi:pyruvate kinase